MIKICDAIMGSGKSTACINYMNSHPWMKFIYISPYLEEDERIWQACKSLHFIRPNTINEEDSHTKFLHTKRLLKTGRNICTTHQLFRRYDSEMLDDIRRHGYTLICDEVIDAIETVSVSKDDIEMLTGAGLIRIEEGVAVRTDKEYRGTLMLPFLQALREREMFYSEPSEDDDSDGPVFTWILPPELLSAFRDVYVLTYMFNGQNMKYMMDLYDMRYIHIGLKKDETGFVFDESVRVAPVPSYLADIHSLISIYQGENLNSIGDGRTALSKNWFRTHPDEADQLRRHLDNWFRSVNEGTRSKDRMWGTLKCAQPMLTGKGYSSSYVVFNKRASNSYRGRTCLAYACNVYMNVSQANFLRDKGISVDNDAYALSTMIQWIWRSAIREGGAVSIYVPSSRMRELLVSWMDGIAEQAGGDAREKLPESIVIDLPDDGSTEIMVPFRLEGCRVIPG